MASSAYCITLPFSRILSFGTILPDLLARLVPLVAVFEPTNLLRRHPPNIERTTIAPRDEPVCNVRQIEPLSFDEASSNAQRLVGVVCDRSSGLVPRSVPDHYVELSVLGGNLRRRRKLDWPTKRIPTR